MSVQLADSIELKDIQLHADLNIVGIADRGKLRAKLFAEFEEVDRQRGVEFLRPVRPVSDNYRMEFIQELILNEQEEEFTPESIPHEMGNDFFGVKSAPGGSKPKPSPAKLESFSALPSNIRVEEPVRVEKGKWVEKPAPVEVEKPAPVVAEKHAPVVVDKPAPVVVEKPAPVVVEKHAEEEEAVPDWIAKSRARVIVKPSTQAPESTPSVEKFTPPAEKPTPPIEKPTPPVIREPDPEPEFKIPTPAPAKPKRAHVGEIQHPKVEVQVKPKPVVESTYEVPSSLIEFIKEHPRCTQEEARRYFSKREVDRNIRLGIITVRNGRLYV